MIHIAGSTLLSSQAVSDLCREAAMRLAMLDSRYQQWHRELGEELKTNGESDQARIIALSLQEIQQEVKDIHEKVRIG